MTYDASVRAYQAAMEIDITRRVVEGLLAAGYELTVNDGEEDVLVRSRDTAAILAAMRSSDEDILGACRYEGNRATERGCVRFVYGNDGWDVVCDYHTSLEPVMAPINEYADRLADGVELASLVPVPSPRLER